MARIPSDNALDLHPTGLLDPSSPMGQLPSTSVGPLVSGSITIAPSEVEPNTVIYPFGANINDTVELHIYSMVDSMLESSYDINFNRVDGLMQPSTGKNIPGTSNGVLGTPSDPGISSVRVDLHNVFRNLGYISGKFKFQLNFHKNVLGSVDSRANLIGISADRTQLTIVYSGSLDNLLSTDLVDQYGNRTEFYLNLGENRLYRIASFTPDPETLIPAHTAYTLVLQQPFPAELGVNSKCWIDVQAADPQNDVIIIYPKKKSDDFNSLRGPNFSIETTDGFAQSTAFKSWDALLGSNPTSSQQLINNLISSSFDPIELAIDYRDYSQFVFYSSAEERLKNFRYKLQLLEYYSSLISSSVSIASPAPAVTTNIADLLVKQNAILSGFDGYEKYLYYESSSYESSSYGEFTPSTWPKQNSTKPYVLYSITSSQANDWYLGQIDSASLYDRSNRSALQYLIPDHIRSDSFNESYTTYVNMIGQHFDVLWSYVHHLNRIHYRDNSLTKGLAKDLIYHVLRSLGIDSINGFKVEELWLNTLGLNSSGQYNQTGSLQSMSGKDIASETWKRILNNLPYLLKTKGTKRGIRALINCYGVPSTVYRIKEYSSPYQYSSNVFEINSQYRKVEKFTRAYDFNGTSTYVSTPLVAKDVKSVQFRFKPIYIPGVTQSLLSGPAELYIYPSGSNTGYGYIRMGTSTPILGPFFNGKWNNVTFTENNLYVFQSEVNKLWGYSGSRATTMAANNFFGKGAYNYFSGSMQEIRVWLSELSVDTIEQHAKNPQSIIGNGTITAYNGLAGPNTDGYDYTAAYNQLGYRWPLGTTLQLYSGSSVTIPSIAPQGSLSNATAYDFTSQSFSGVVEDYYVWYPNLGDGLDIAEKIRIEASSLEGDLSPKHSVEKNQFDTFFTDSPKVGVFFSPQDEINEDIADQFSGLSMDDILGDPREDYTYTYKELEKLRNHYHLKYRSENTFWKYTKLIENFDASMFYLIKKFLPARSVKMVGLVIQPTLLERSKIPLREVFSEREDYEMNFSELPDELLGENLTLECEPIQINNHYQWEIGNYDNDVEIEVPHTFSFDVSSNLETTITVIQGAISTNVEYVNDNTAIRFLPTGRYNHMFGGCKISSRGFNIPSQDTPDGSPVVEFWTNNPNNPTNFATAAGALSTTNPPTGRFVNTTPNNLNSLNLGLDTIRAGLGGRAIVNYTDPTALARSTAGRTTSTNPTLGPMGGRVVVNYTDPNALEGRAIVNRNNPPNLQ